MLTDRMLSSAKPQKRYLNCENSVLSTQKKFRSQLNATVLLRNRCHRFFLKVWHSKSLEKSIGTLKVLKNHPQERNRRFWHKKKSRKALKSDEKSSTLRSHHSNNTIFFIGCRFFFKISQKFSDCTNAFSNNQRSSLQCKNVTKLFAL